MSREKQLAGAQLAEAEENVGSETGESPDSVEAIVGQEGAETIVTDMASLDGDDAVQGKMPWIGLSLLAVGMILAVGLALLAARRKKNKKEQNGMLKSLSDRQKPPADQWQTVQITPELYRADQAFVCEVGRVHHIGRRQTQQDSLGVTPYSNGKGILAVVADGMGGLANGDRVSQRIVLTMLQDSALLEGNQAEGALYRMLAHANREVNSMLGTAGQYKSGSTVVAVMVEAGYFQWISVGDSRLYLYRGHHLFQVNREHVHEADLWKQAVMGETAFSEIAGDSQKRHISSFIGMGELRHIDGSIRPVPIYRGDKLLLMSDGVFNTLSEQEICDVLLQEGTAQRAAQTLESLVLARQNPKQDNLTAVILDI